MKKLFSVKDIKHISKTLFICLLTIMLSLSVTGCNIISGILNPHKHETVHTKPKASTCTEKGNVEYWYCSGCKKYFLDENCQLEISEKTTVVPLAEHSFESFTIVKNPTETEEGLKTSVCSVCGEEVSEVIPKLAHTHKYATEWQYDIGGHWNLPVCGCEDAPVGNYAEHTSSGDGKCSVCGYDVASNDLLSLSGGKYGYGTLSGNDAAFYDLLDKKIASFHKKGNALVTPSGLENNYTLEAIDFSSFGLSKDRAMNVYSVFKADNPLYYWLSTKTLYSSSALYPVVTDDFASETERLKTNAELETSVRAFYKRANVGDSDYRKALLYHDAIVEHVDYAYDDAGYPSTENWAHNVLGVFLNGTKTIDGAVCEGYAKAFQLLLNLSGIDNLIVTGVGFGNGGYENHAWNLVKIDNKYYNFDLTWDDQPFSANGKIYTYFCKPETDDNFKESHFANKTLVSSSLKDDKLYDLPKNVAEAVYSSSETIFTELSEDGFNYVIDGYNSLQLISCYKTGNVVIPETVKRSGIEYEVSTIGAIYGNVNTLSPVLKRGVISVSIPSRTRFIWDVALRCSTLTSVSVADGNQRFSSLNGVLYTKNKYTVVYYPPKKAGFTYTVASNCKIIALYAFDNCHLSTLTVGQNLTYYYIPNYGLGYCDSDEEYALKSERISALCNNINSSGVTANLNVEQFKTATGISHVNVN